MVVNKVHSEPILTSNLIDKINNVKKSIYMVYLNYFLND